jgi:hypothetical protein
MRARWPTNDPESTEGRALSTDQIAAAGAEREDSATSSQDPLYAPAEQSVPAQQSAPGSDPGAGDQPRAQLLEDNELQNLLVQWKDIQAESWTSQGKRSRPLMPSLPSSCSG